MWFLWALMKAADVGVKAADVEGSKQPMCRTKAADVRPKAADVRSKQPMSGQSIQSNFEFLSWCLRFKECD